jgi:hypothetical protein
MTLQPAWRSPDPAMFCWRLADSHLCTWLTYADSALAAAAGVAVDRSDGIDLTGVDVDRRSGSGHAESCDEEGDDVHVEYEVRRWSMRKDSGGDGEKSSRCEG